MASSAGSLSAYAPARALLPSSVKSAGTLQIGTRNDSPPGESKSASGAVTGYEIDLMTDVAKLLGVTPQYTYLSFDSLVPALQADRVEAAFGSLGDTAARQKLADIVPWTEFGSDFLAATSSNLKITSMMQLCGHSVATTAGGLAVKFVQQTSAKCTAAGKPKVGLQTYATITSDVLAVTTGRADMYYGPAPIATYTASQSNGKLKDVGNDLSAYKPFQYGVGTLKNSPLAPALAKAINRLITLPQYKQILAKWGLSSIAITHTSINPPAAG